MAKKVGAGKKKQGSLEGSLAALGQRVDQAKATRPGTIVFHASGAGSASYRLNTGLGPTSVSRFTEAAEDRQPLIEVIGEAVTIQAVIDGEKDAVKTFLSGGIRVRGDLRYLSDLALELGFIDRPL
jgi:hypothetical protein